MNGAIGIDRTISVASMTWNPAGNGAAESSLPSYKVLHYGDLAFEGNRTKGHPYGKLVIDDIGTGIMSSRFRTLKPVAEICVPFWKFYLQNTELMRPLYIRATKRGTLMTELVPEELLKCALRVPSLSEQRAIGQFFATLDRLIALRQQELDETKLLKKAYLQRMFV